MDEIKPALTAEQWDAVATEVERLRDNASVALEYTGSQEAAEAEIRLEEVTDSIRRGQPFGFTWDDVDDERECYRLAVVAATHAQQVGDEAERVRLKALAGRCSDRADRIAALLPRQP